MSTSTHTARDSKQFAQNLTFVLLLLFLVGGLVVVANRWADREGLQAIDIRGTTVLDSSEVVELVSLPDTGKLEHLDFASIERELVLHPFISDARVWYSGSGRLVFDVSERSPVAVTIRNQRPVYLDAEGIALPFRFGVSAPDVPVIGAHETNRVLDSASIADLLDVVAAIREFDELLYTGVSEVMCDRDGMIYLSLVDRLAPAIVGLPDGLEGKLAKLRLFLNEVIPWTDRSRLAGIDLRWRNQVVVQHADETKPA